MIKKRNLPFELTKADERGGVAVYTAVAIMITLGAGALSLDYGRMTLVHTQMQNRADAARAEDVARNATRQATGVRTDGSVLDIQTVRFYEQVSPAKVLATGDEDSRFIEIVMAPRQIDLMLRTVLNRDAVSKGRVSARATAGITPFICNAPPLMVCDPGESDPTEAIDDVANIGRQIVLKPPPQSGFWGPGNYGLLALPDGSNGADAISTALAAVEPQQCYTLDVETAPGVKTNKIRDGINARFDHPGGLPYPAPNVIHFPKDDDIADGTVPGTLGSGAWGIDAYWTTKHGGPLPGDLAGATRYQTYLYELGETFARNGKETVFPVPSDGAPGGFVTVTPPGVNIPEDPSDPDNPAVDGMPDETVASNGPARRLARVAILNCAAESVQGNHAYPTDGRYVEMFITESVPDSPAGAIYGEIVRTITTTNDPDYHANAALVE